MRVYVLLWDQDGYGHSTLRGVYAKKEDAEREMKELLGKYPRYVPYDFMIYDEDVL